MHRSPVERTAFFPDDSTLPGLALLGDASAMLSHVRQFGFGDVRDCRIAHVRYKPATNCVVAYELTVSRSKQERDESVWTYAKCYHAHDFSAAVAKAELRRDKDSSTHALPAILNDQRCIIYALPHDAELAGIETMLDSRKLVRVLHSALPEFPRELYRISDTKLRVSTIRFKPEKRAVFRIDTKLTRQDDPIDRRKLCLYARLYADNHGAQIFDLMSRLDSVFGTSDSLAIPTPALYNDEKKILLMHSVAGTPVSDLLTNPDAIAAVEQAGHSLALLHRFKDSRLPSRSIREYLEDVTTAVHGLSAVLPEVQERAAQLVTKLRIQLGHDQVAEQGFIHGDFHPGQVLFGEKGKGTILDFDRSGHGELLADLGNFVAHLHLSELIGTKVRRSALADHFICGYEAGSGSKVSSDRLRCWTALGLLQLAISPFRNGHGEWRQLGVAAIEGCQEIL